MTKKIKIGFDLGGTKMYCLALDENYKILSSYKTESQGFHGVKKGARTMIMCINEAIKKIDFTPVIHSIGVGVPGIVNNEKGTLVNSPNLGWSNFAIRDILSKEFSCPVSVLNDVDAGTFGEYKIGAGKKSKSLFGVFPGTGLGGGFVHNGKLITGKKYSCMEIGHMNMPSNSLQSESIGKPIPWEYLCSRLSMASEATVEAYRGNAPYILKNYGTDIRKIKSKVFNKAIKNGDESIKKIVDNSIYYLSMGISNIINILAPDTVLLGGGLVEAMPDLFIKKVKKNLENMTLNVYLEDLKINICNLGDDAVALGASLYANEKKL